jgi:tRNA A37 threonylcarbamoyltransferase TsaD
MFALGIEGTAHTVGVGIVDEAANVLANEIKMYKPEQGGIHPREAANHHAENVVPLVQKALETAALMYYPYIGALMGIRGGLIEKTFNDVCGLHLLDFVLDS